MTRYCRSFIILVALVFVSSAAAKKKSMRTDIIDPNYGGKPYGAGAVFNLTQKGFDFVNQQITNVITSGIRSMVLPNFTTAVKADGQMNIDSLRVGDFSTAIFRYEFPERTRVIYWTENNRLTASGNYQFTNTTQRKLAGKSTGKNKADEPKTETGRVSLFSGDADLNITAEFRRTYDGKPTMALIDCLANFSKFSVEYTPGKPEYVNATLEKLRKHFQDAVCKLMRDYVDEVFGAALSTFPSRIQLLGDNKYVLDYDLLNNQPELAGKSLKAELKGQVLWQNYYTAPFSPAYEISAPQTGQNAPERMMNFRLGDYAFNTLFHHLYWQNQLRMSAYDSIPESNPLRDRLRLRCPPTRGTGPSCFGDVFGNATDNFPPTAIGDLVFRPDRRPPTVLIRSTVNGTSYFDAYGGQLEAYVVTDFEGTKRELLARFNVIAINGDFTPALSNKMNLTGSIRLTDFQLATYVTRYARQMKNIDSNEQWREDLTRLATPIVEYMINQYFEKYAQFPLYLSPNIECIPPAGFRLTDRTMNVDCDLRPLNGGQRMFMSLEETRKLRKAGRKN